MTCHIDTVWYVSKFSIISWPNFVTLEWYISNFLPRTSLCHDSRQQLHMWIVKIMTQISYESERAIWKCIVYEWSTKKKKKKKKMNIWG